MGTCDFQTQCSFIRPFLFPSNFKNQVSKSAQSYIWFGKKQGREEASKQGRKGGREGGKKRRYGEKTKVEEKRKKEGMNESRNVLIV